MIHYENMTKDRIISLLKDTLEYAEEKDKEIERLTKQNKALNEMYGLTKKEYIRLNNIINNAIKGIEDYYYGDKEYKEYDYTLAYQIYHILKGDEKE